MLWSTKFGKPGGGARYAPFVTLTAPDEPRDDVFCGAPAQAASNNTVSSENASRRMKSKAVNARLMTDDVRMVAGEMRKRQEVLTNYLKFVR